MGRALRDLQLQFTCLPKRCDGVGVRTVRESHCPAYLASRVESVPSVELLINHQFDFGVNFFWKECWTIADFILPTIEVEDLLRCFSLANLTNEKFSSKTFHSLFWEADFSTPRIMLSYTLVLPYACGYLSAPSLQNLELSCHRISLFQPCVFKFGCAFFIPALFAQPAIQKC